MSSEMTKEPNTGLAKDEVLSLIEKDIEQQKKNIDSMISLKGALSSIDVGAGKTITSNDLAEFHAKLGGDSALDMKAPDTGLTKNEMLGYIEKGVEQQKKNIVFLDSLKEVLNNGEASCPANAEVDSFLFYSHLTITTPASQGTKGEGNSGGIGIGTNVSHGTLSGDLSNLGTLNSYEITTAGVGLGWVQIHFWNPSNSIKADYVGYVGTDVSIFIGAGSMYFFND